MPNRFIIGHSRMRPLDVYFEQYASIRSENGCIEWSGPRHPYGYGVIAKNKKRRLAHRVAWERKHGPIPDGMLVCHHCDNPPCVNVNHMFLGTHSDNALDMVAKGRKSPNVGRGVRHGMAKLTESDVREIRRLASIGLPLREIANLFNLKYSGTRSVVKRETWRHVA